MFNLLLLLLLKPPQGGGDHSTMVIGQQRDAAMMPPLLLRPRTTKDGSTVVSATVNGPLEGGFAKVVLHMVSRVWAAGAGGAGGRCD